MTSPSATFAERLDSLAAACEATLDRALAATAASGEIERPRRLIEAMRYAALGGGKRLRPYLVVASAGLFNAPREQALLVGAALECIHCYSLIHDDLPAMDNDDLRRGRPTAHRAFDEATAILAGDALLTLAFDLLAREEAHHSPQVRIELVGLLARAAGVGGMVGGQMLDLAAEGRFAGETAVAMDIDATLRMQSMKTGALLRFACVAGGVLGGATRDERAALEAYGARIGQAFQIADDLLDAEGDPATLGKAAGKDAAAGKATLVGALGAAAARARLVGMVDEAARALDIFGARSAELVAAARFVAERKL